MNGLRDTAAVFGLTLTDAQLASFQRYYEMLLEWNKWVNLTRITDPEEVAIRHFLDSLTCLLVLPGTSSLNVIDVGSGAGFPGVPLKIVRPDLSLTLLDSAGKKTLFLERVAAALGLCDVSVVHGRAEDLGRDPAFREKYDVSLARAVAPLATLAEYCLPFVRPGGKMIAQKTASIAAEIAAAKTAVGLLGGELTATREVTLPGLSLPRLLVVIEKRRPTPTEFPRRPGVPAKQPLGSDPLKKTRKDSDISLRAGNLIWWNGWRIGSSPWFPFPLDSARVQ